MWLSNSSVGRIFGHTVDSIRVDSVCDGKVEGVVRRVLQQEATCRGLGNVWCALQQGIGLHEKTCYQCGSFRDQLSQFSQPVKSFAPLPTGLVTPARGPAGRGSPKPNPVLVFPTVRTKALQILSVILSPEEVERLRAQIEPA